MTDTMRTAIVLLTFLTPLGRTSLADQRPVAIRDHEKITIGSKAFTESYLLAEMIAQTLEKSGIRVERDFGMGGTGILFQALTTAHIQIYPEYSGTIAETILKNPHLNTLDQIRTALRPLRLTISESLGFSNSYALAMHKATATQYDVHAISDLNRIKDHIRSAFSNEFMTREDGYPRIKTRYGFELNDVHSMEHSLAFEALAAERADLIDVYTTDGRIDALDLVILQDDAKVFPEYEAVWLARQDFVDRNPQSWAILRSLEGSLSAEQMRTLNAHVDLHKATFAEAVSVSGNPLKSRQELAPRFKSALAEVWLRTKQHLFLVSVALVFACLLGIPCGFLAAAYPLLGQFILLISSILQTIPSLALLCFLIPLFGIGSTAALAALFLYGLLPIVYNTHSGLVGIDARLREMARSLGLSRAQRLWYIDLPLASPQILTGVRTSLIIGIGTATLAALIGAGGYGVPILTGLAVNDMNTILSGAIPTALMAIISHLLFNCISRWLTPPGLRNSSQTES